jgi:hypothetical protein
MAHDIRELEDELATLIDSLDPEVGAVKTQDWYTWRDRLMNYVVKKVLESYRHGREGITDAVEAGTAAGKNKAPAGHGSHTNGPHSDDTPRSALVNPQRRESSRGVPHDASARGRVDRQ